jgi:hypothetical protein
MIGSKRLATSIAAFYVSPINDNLWSLRAPDGSEC